MPDIDLFFDQEDEYSFVQFILARGGRFVGNTQSSSQYEVIKGKDAYVTARVDERLFHVLFDSYEECALELYLIPSGYYAGKYHVMQRTGGPTIDFARSVQYQEDGVNWISTGFVGYYPTYRNTITGEMERPPDALVKQYKELLSYVKKDSKLIKGKSGRKYLIGPHTYQLIREGKLHLGVKGLSVE